MEALTKQVQKKKITQINILLKKPQHQNQKKMETQTILKAIPTHRTQAILTHQQTQLMLKNNLVRLNTQKLKLQHFQQKSIQKMKPGKTICKLLHQD